MESRNLDRTKKALKVGDSNRNGREKAGDRGREMGIERQ